VRGGEPGGDLEDFEENQDSAGGGEIGIAGIIVVRH
jgi:hypothetical protein